MKTLKKVTRVEVIDEKGRSYVNWEKDNNVEIDYQDDGRTLKIFISKRIPEPEQTAAEDYLDYLHDQW